jgi:predicted nucleic acid-binding protein
MSFFFLDSSALVKRYMPETGTGWLRQLLSLDEHQFFIAEITPLEMMSAAARHYHDDQISLEALHLFRDHMMYDMQSQYRTLRLSSMVIRRALTLHEQIRLRAYDSVQLASALIIDEQIEKTGRRIQFISADTRLLQAAAQMGLHTDNPNHHSHE